MTARKPAKAAKMLVIRKVGPGEWSVMEKAVPGFRLSKSTMAAVRQPKLGNPRGV